VCVNDAPSTGPYAAGLHRMIRKGSVYTIRDIDHRAEFLLHGAPTIRLEEVVAPIQLGTILEWSWEPGFHPRRFRPVIERKTDISIFTEMLTPKVREREDIGT